MKIGGIEFLIGADPEFFIAREGNPVSAYGMFPGSKTYPCALKKGAVQVDGMALEINTKPVKGLEDFEIVLKSVMDEVQEMMPKNCTIYRSPVTELDNVDCIKSVADFETDYINNQPKVARELGCEPDYNAYTGLANPAPKESVNYRTGAGHIHIGWTEENVDVTDKGHIEACQLLTKYLDLFVGVPSRIWDIDPRRRNLYGKAGAYRPKPYGVEYRYLSNVWLSNPLWRKVVFKGIEMAINNAFEDRVKVNSIKTPNGCDVKSFLNGKIDHYDVDNCKSLGNEFKWFSDTFSLPSPLKMRQS